MQDSARFSLPAPAYMGGLVAAIALTLEGLGVTALGGKLELTEFGASFSINIISKSSGS